jgi:nucleoid-associated protein YgaU
VGVDAPPAALAIGWVEADSTAIPASPPPSGAPSGIAPSDAAPIGAALIGTATQPSIAYVVQPGDSLWRITEALLGADASAAHIAASWPALYEANRDSIGDNPSLIQPGLALTVPAGLGA